MDSIGLFPQGELPHDAVRVWRTQMKKLVVLGLKGPFRSRVGHDKLMISSGGLLTLKDVEWIFMVGLQPWSREVGYGPTAVKRRGMVMLDGGHWEIKLKN